MSSDSPKPASEAMASTDSPSDTPAGTQEQKATFELPLNLPSRLSDIVEDPESTIDIDDTSSVGSWQAVTRVKKAKQPEEEDDPVEEIARPRSIREDYHALHHAVVKGDLEAIQTKLDSGLDIERKSADGYTLLVMAIMEESVKTLKFLLEKGADPHHRTLTLPPLVHALMRDNHTTELMQLLLDHGALLTTTSSSHHKNALHWAASEGKVEAVDFLISKGMDLEKQCSKGRTPLILAAEKGHTSVAKVLVAKGAEYKEAKSKNGGTPLIWSACNGHLESVKYWIELGADVNAKDENGLSAISLAAHSGHVEIVEYLLENGADVNTLCEKPKAFTTTMAAACAGHDQVVKVLIAYGADLTLRNAEGDNALDAAMLEHHTKAVKVLLKAMGGEDYPEDSVALQIALANGHRTILSLMTTASLMYPYIEPENKEKEFAWIDWVLEKGGELVKPRAMHRMLHAALQEQNFGMVKALVQHGCDVNAWLDSGCTPLMFAVTRRDVELIPILLEAGADPSKYRREINSTVCNALDLALFEMKDGEDTEIVDLLLANDRCKINKGTELDLTAFAYVLSLWKIWPEGVAEKLARRMIDSIPDVNDDNCDAGSLLHVATLYEREDMVELLMSRGANIEATMLPRFTPFMLACQRNPKMIPLLISHGADVQIKYESNSGALHGAAAYGLPGALEVLLDECGFEVEQPSTKGFTALLCALAWGKEDNAMFLLSRGASVNVQTEESKRTPLHCVAEMGMERAAKAILERNEIDVNVKDNKGLTPLHDACMTGSFELVRLLLDAGADIEAALPDGERPLHTALINDHDLVAEYLVDRGADVNVCTSKKRSPLHIAAGHYLPRAARRMLSKGANTEATDDETWTPLCISDGPLLTQILIEHGANVNYEDKDKWTPLHQAVFNSDIETARVLLLNGADTTVRTTDDGLTARERAEDLKNEQIRRAFVGLLAREESMRLVGPVNRFRDCYGYEVQSKGKIEDKVEDDKAEDRVEEILDEEVLDKKE